MRAHTETAPNPVEVFGKPQRTQSTFTDGSEALRSEEASGRHISNDWPSLSSRLAFFHVRSQPKKHPVVRELEGIQQKLVSGEYEPDKQPWVNTTSGNMFFGIIILLNSAFIGVDIEVSGSDGEAQPYMVAIESLFLVAFWVEIILRVRASGPRAFCGSRWGPFDVICTLLGSLDAWVITPLQGASSTFSGISVLRTLRLLRLLRLLRVFRTFKGLASLATVLSNSVQAVLWLFLLLLIFVYMSSIFVTTLLEDRADEDGDIGMATRNLGVTMFYHLMLLTGEGYTKVWVTPTWRISGWWLLYWVACVIWLHIIMLNLMVGVLVQQTMGSQKDKDDALANLAAESMLLRQTLLTLFSTSDVNADGALSAKELNDLLDGRHLDQILRAFRVATDVPRDCLLQAVGLAPGSESITFEEFYEACVRLCGSSRDIRSFMLQVDVARLRHDVLRRARTVRSLLLPKAARPGSAPPSHDGPRPGERLRALLRRAHERMELLEAQQDALLEALTSLRSASSSAPRCSVLAR